MNGHRLTVAGEVKPAIHLQGAHGAETLALGFPVEKVGAGDIAPIALVSAGQNHDPVGLGEGQGTQDHGINDAEQRGVGANA
jgi:hypothetical protein